MKFFQRLSRNLSVKNVTVSSHILRGLLAFLTESGILWELTKWYIDEGLYLGYNSVVRAVKEKLGA